jgi:uncharacterized protein
MQHRPAAKGGLMKRRKTLPLVDSSSKPTLAPESVGQSRFHLFAKPRGTICNLDCKYCVFLAKEGLYPDSAFRMSAEVLAEYLHQYLASQSGPEINIAWQGGEPTLMGLDFFRQSILLERRHARPGTYVKNTLQTNGILLDDDWCAFFKEHDFLIEFSLDGPRELHDAYRVDKDGHPTFDQAMRGLRCLQKHGVEVRALTGVHAANGDHPLEVYRFLRDEAQIARVQLIPIVERVEATVTDRSVGAEQYGRFLNAIFDEWVRHDVGRVFVQMFDVALAAWVGVPSGVCVFSPTCGDALTLEHNGDLYSCDHFAEPLHLLGNIEQRHMAAMVASSKQRKFGRAKLDTLPQYCRKCQVRFACHGGCPKDRFIETPTGEPGLNYLCAGYKAFFFHVDEPMRAMAKLLRSGREAAEIMRNADC